MQPSFWSGKKILLTGHTGFQGAWFSLWLQSLGAEAVGYSLPPPTRPSLFELAGVAAGMASETGDVRDLAALERCFAKHRPELVIHFAAQALVRRSYEDPVTTMATNVLGTTHVLEAARRCAGLRAVLCITSDKCYQNRETSRGYAEIDPLGGSDPYSASKAAAELAVEAYRRSYFSGSPDKAAPAVASGRAGNVIGGGDWAEDRLVPDAMRALLEKRPVLVRHPEAVRPWQHVLEPLEGYLTLLEKLGSGERAFARAWNFGPPPEAAQPVSRVVDRLVALWGEGAVWRREENVSWHEDTLLCLDAAQAQEHLGWRTRLSLEESLEWIVAWYRAYREGRGIREFSLSQIQAYQRRIGV